MLERPSIIPQLFERVEQLFNFGIGTFVTGYLRIRCNTL